jgi:hypothetical protein
VPVIHAAKATSHARRRPLDFHLICRYVDGMDDLRGHANVISATTAAMPSVDAFWFSFTYYACPALLEGGEST